MIYISKINDKDALQYAISSGIINLDDVRMRMEEMRRQELLDMHPYKIWQGKDGEWYTRFYDDTGKGKLKHRKTLAELEDVIVAYMKDKVECPTIESVFMEWIKLRLERNEITNATYSRYLRDFKRYFDKTKSCKIQSVSELEIEDFMKRRVQELGLTRKAFSNMRTLVYGIFRYAKKKGYVKFSIKEVVSDIEFSKSEFKKVHHEDNEQVFMIAEEGRMIDYLQENEDLLNMGLLLLFKTGLRIGELVALNKEDICGNIIHINKTETIYQDEEGVTHYDIKHVPKTEAGIRDVIVPDNCMWILNRIKRLCPFGQYVFMQDGERIRSYIFRTRLYSNCKKLQIVVKSPHKVRKTYGSKLYDSDSITEAFMIEQMGHTDITCLKKHYYYNRMGNNEKRDMLNQAAVL